MAVMAEMKATLLEARAAQDARTGQLEMRGAVAQNAQLLRELQVREDKGVGRVTYTHRHGTCSYSLWRITLQAAAQGMHVVVARNLWFLQVMTEDSKSLRDRTEMALLALKDTTSRWVEDKGSLTPNGG